MFNLFKREEKKVQKPTSVLQLEIERLFNLCNNYTKTYFKEIKKIGIIERLDISTMPMSPTAFAYLELNTDSKYYSIDIGKNTTYADYDLTIIKRQVPACINDFTRDMKINVQVDNGTISVKPILNENLGAKEILELIRTVFNLLAEAEQDLMKAKNIHLSEIEKLKVGV